VVTHDVGAGARVAGVPARLLKDFPRDEAGLDKSRAP
jgi:acetyltransferase-like isoleucine patch superfamily enzyme